MAETTAPGDAAGASSSPASVPTIAPGQTTTPGEATQTTEGQPAPAAEESKSFSLWDNPFLFIVLALWLWFLFGNKKRKAQKAQEKKDRERLSTLQKGDIIITIGRMHGTVVAFTEATVTIKPDPKADYSMTFDRQAIFRVMPRDEEEEEAEAAGNKR